jgi:hypothetical protein
LDIYGFPLVLVRDAWLGVGAGAVTGSRVC